MPTTTQGIHPSIHRGLQRVEVGKPSCNSFAFVQVHGFLGVPSKFAPRRLQVRSNAVCRGQFHAVALHVLGRNGVFPFGEKSYQQTVLKLFQAECCLMGPRTKDTHRQARSGMFVGRPGSATNGTRRTGRTFSSTAGGGGGGGGGGVVKCNVGPFSSTVHGGHFEFRNSQCNRYNRAKAVKNLQKSSRMSKTEQLPLATRR